MTKGPIVIIDDDKDDQDSYAECIRAIGVPNEIHFFREGQEALDYLSTTDEQPFIIMSDVNMPGMSGLELKRTMHEDAYLTAKGIPFVFISTSATKSSVRHAHALSAQGYFEKPTSIEEIKRMMQTIFNYWELCRHINNT